MGVFFPKARWQLAPHHLHPAFLARPDQVPDVVGALKRRFGGVMDRVLCTLPLASDDERRAHLAELRAE